MNRIDMNRIEQLKQSIKDCKKAIKEYKEKIKQLESKTVLEVGRWYWSSKGCSNEALVFVESIDRSIDRSIFRGYGINIGGWDYCSNWSVQCFDTLATDKEVETALISEAKKRYKKGDSLNSFIGHSGIEVINDVCGVKFYPTENKLMLIGAGEDGYGLNVFHKGKWAEIIKTTHVPEGDYTTAQLKDLVIISENK